MMASFKFALLLFFGLFGSALTSAVEIEGLLKDQDALKHDTQNGSVCQNCTETFEILAEVFSSADLQEKIFDEKLCDDLTAPPNVSKVCKGEVKQMLPLALNLIFAHMESENSSIDLHTEPFGHVPGFHFGSQLPTNVKKKLIPCLVCRTILTIIVNMLPADRSEEAVVEVLKHVCSTMPHFLKQKCSSLLEKFGKEILDLLLTYKAPSVICKIIRLC